MKSFLLCFLILANVLCVSSALSKPLDDIKVQLSWRHQFQFAGFYAAVQQGFYKEVGLNVTLLEGGPGISCNEVILLKQVQYCNASGSVVRRKLEGEKIVVLASIIQHSPLVLLTLKSSGLDTPKSLIGKKVESMLVGEPIVEIKAMFQKQGIDLTMLNNYENSIGINDLVNGKVDAMFGFISNEPHQLEEAGIEYNVISPSDYGIDFYGDVILTSEQEIENYEGRAQRFKEATIKGWQYALDNKMLVVEHIIQHYDKTKNKQALIAEANAIDKLILPNLIKIGHNNIERWEATAATLASINAVEANYSLDGFVYQNGNTLFSKSFILLVGAGFLLLGLGLIILWLYTRRLRTEVQRHIRGRNRLQVAQKAAIKKAYTDELSGMANRRSCYEYGAIAIEDAKKNKDPISIIMIDIDHFKKINDVHGHAIGDEFICAMAKVIIGRIRETDIHGRIGGEEFAIILPDTNLEMAGELAEDIRKILEATEVMVGEKPLKMTASFGVAKLENASDDINFVMKRADEALYKAKNTGRNKVVMD